jgi:hypothetical protein
MPLQGAALRIEQLGFDEARGSLSRLQVLGIVENRSARAKQR